MSCRECEGGRAEQEAKDDCSCVYECPSGFICESADANHAGICCPDLDVLYELYGDGRSRSSVEPSTSTTLSASSTAALNNISSNDQPATDSPKITVSDNPMLVFSIVVSNVLVACWLLGHSNPNAT